MDFSRPLANLPAGLEASALGVVARVEIELTGRQIARIAGAGSPDNIRRALLRLADVGLVSARPTPYATLYSANREHLLWPAVASTLRAGDELRARIIDFTESTGPEGVAVSLYGSVARDESTASSDVDLVVVFADGTARIERDEFLRDLQSSVERWSGNSAQIYDVDRAGLRRQRASGDPLVTSWLSDGIALVGREIRALAG